MSVLRDANLVTYLKNLGDYSEVSEEGTRHLLSQTELFMRRVIREAAGLAMQYNRSQIKLEDLDTVLKDLNMQFLSRGVDRSSILKHRNEDLCLREYTEEILSKNLKPKQPVRVNFNWKLFGEQSKQSDNKELITNDQLEPAKINNFSVGAHQQTEATFLIKELTPNFITKEAYLFLEALNRTLEEYFKAIDKASPDLTRDSSHFEYGVIISCQCFKKCPESTGFITIHHNTCS